MCQQSYFFCFIREIDHDQTFVNCEVRKIENIFDLKQIERIDPWNSFEFTSSVIPRKCFKSDLFHPFIKYITNEKTQEKCYILIDAYWIFNFAFVKEEQTLEKCLDVVKKDGMNLRYIEARKQTVEICMAALSNNPSSEKYVKIELNIELDYLLNMIGNLGIVF